MTGQLSEVNRTALEHDPDRPLQCTSTADAIHAALAAAEGAGDGAEAGSTGRAAPVGQAKLRRVAQLECVETDFRCRLTIDVELLEDREVVLDVARATELVSARIAQGRS